MDKLEKGQLYTHTAHGANIPALGPYSPMADSSWAGILPQYPLITQTTHSHTQSAGDEASLHTVPRLAAF